MKNKLKPWDLPVKMKADEWLEFLQKTLGVDKDEAKFLSYFTATAGRLSHKTVEPFDREYTWSELVATIKMIEREISFFPVPNASVYSLIEKGYIVMQTEGVKETTFRATEGLLDKLQETAYQAAA